MRGHGEPERPALVLEPQLDRPTGQIGAVDAEGVLDSWLQRRMGRREEDENEGECVHGYRMAMAGRSFKPW